MTVLPAHKSHPRVWENFQYVYPVLSRRSHGISIGVNVNPDKVCNFDCIYCQVDRTVPATVTKFDLAVAEGELREILKVDFSQHPPFDSVPKDKLRINDIALSGDAEPTTLRNFSATIEMIARVKPAGVKIVLITDAGGLDRPDVKRGLEIMDAHDGEVWAKLDAGTDEYFKLINRTKIPFARILKNIAGCAKQRPVVIQSLFLNVRGVGPGDAEIAAYCQRLREIGAIRLVQVYTLARPPMAGVAGLTALANAEVDAITEHVRREAGVPAESFYGN
jgi:wyosine [tRNA(Phe)-imidazoG37] synthetase (radical SAM superfamily)